MTHEFHYDSDLIGGSLQVRESRIIADLLLTQANEESWKQAILTDNILQKRSPATATRASRALRSRLERVEPAFWQAIRDGDDELATQASLCATLERNLLLVEFMETVVKDAYLTQANKLEAWQWDEFLEDRVHRDPAIAGWADSSKRKMGQVAMRILVEAGYLRSSRSPVLQHVLLRSEIRSLLDDTYRHRIKACLEISSPNQTEQGVHP